jgi:hypothetical protein
VAQRIETLLVPAETAAANGHALYFNLVIAIHALVGAGLAVWRAITPAPVEQETYAEAPGGEPPVAGRSA